MNRALVELLVLPSRLATAAVFGWAAWLKLQEPLDFYFSIKGFKIFEGDTLRLVEPLAFMVPWIEMVCAAALVLGFWARSASIVLAGMLLVFIGAIASVLVRGISTECGCFGDFTLICPPGQVGWCNIGQNVLLLAVALPVVIWGPGTLSWDAAARRLGGGGGRGGSAEGPAGPMDSEPAGS